MARKNLNMKKILKAIAFLSLSMCLMLSTNVVYAGECYKDGIRTGGTQLRDINEFRIYIPYSDLVFLDNSLIGNAERVSLKKKILGCLSRCSYSTQMVELPSFEISESTAKEWYSLAKDNGSCGVILYFSFSKNGKYCSYSKVEAQQK